MACIERLISAKRKDFLEAVVNIYKCKNSINFDTQLAFENLLCTYTLL